MEKEQKHPAAALIVSSMGKDAPEEDGEEQGEKEGQMAATQELMDALKEGDHEKFASALEAFIQMCQ